MTLLDEVMTWASILTLKRACVAAELTVRLLRPIEAGQSIRVEGWILKARSRLVESEGQIMDSRRKVLATASGKYVSMPGEGLHLCLEDFVESPGAIKLPFLQVKHEKDM